MNPHFIRPVTKGMENALLKALFEECKNRGIQKLSLSVDSNNRAAMRLYHRFGFEEVGKVDTSIRCLQNYRRDI